MMHTCAQKTARFAIKTIAAVLCLWGLLTFEEPAHAQKPSPSPSTGRVTVYPTVPVYAFKTTEVQGVSLAPEAAYLSPAPFQPEDPSLLTSGALFLKEKVGYRKTLLEEIGSTADWATEEWWKDGIEKQFAAAIQQYSITNGNFATTKDSPLAAHPPGFSYEKQMLFQQSMADSLKHYLIIRGIPKFLSSHEETKAIGHKYEATMKAVATVATVSVATKSKWTFKTGVNPFNMNAWISYSNPKWNYEADSHLTEGTLDVFVQRQFKFNYSGELRCQVKQRVLVSSLSKKFTSQLTGNVSNSIPFSDPPLILERMYTSTGLNYSF